MDRVKTFAVALLLALTLLVGLISGMRVAFGETPTIPQCTEDEPFLRGRGDFDGRFWERYQCMHVDLVRVKRS
jgi:hypothetical protein